MSDGRFNMVIVLAAAALLFNCMFGTSAFVTTPLMKTAPQLRASKLGGQLLASTEEADANGSRSSFASSSASSLLLLAAGAAGAMAIHRGLVARNVNAPKKVKLELIPRPENLLESPKFPAFMGTTDGYLAKGTRERHAITWVGKEEKCFEMPSGGCAIMNKGDNLAYFRRKEHTILLTKTLRKLKLNDIKVYRIKKDGTVVFMHPLDGLWPENQTTGRPLVNWRPFPISGNPEQGKLKWSKYMTKSFEADPLTCMFVAARAAAFDDQETLFPQPNATGFVADEDKDETDRKFMEAVNQIQDLPKIFKP